ncbi:MAG: CIA30 family protein [Bacteroidota bacterium]
MKHLFFLSILIASCMSSPNTTSPLSPDTKNSGNTILYSFPQQGKGNWRVRNDVVMGGRSNSQLKMTTEGNAHFTGSVSLENNGGFCSIYHSMEGEPPILKDKTTFFLRVKGDGKDYSFRVRKPGSRYSYAFKFPTKEGEDWETIAIPFHAMEATFRGWSVDVPNYAGEAIVEMRILIGNKRAEDFDLFIDAVEVN